MGHEPDRLALAQARMGGKAAIEHGSKIETLVELRERAENAMRMLIESLPMGLVITDEKGNITDLNESLVRMFGYSREELLGQTVETLLPARLRTAHQAHRAGYLKHPQPRPKGRAVKRPKGVHAPGLDVGKNTGQKERMIQRGVGEDT